MGLMSDTLCDEARRCLGVLMRVAGDKLLGVGERLTLTSPSALLRNSNTGRLEQGNHPATVL